MNARIHSCLEPSLECAPDLLPRLEHLYATVGAKGKVITTEFSFNQELAKSVELSCFVAQEPKEHQTKYELNFAKMSQCNMESKKSRTIRRKGPCKDAAAKALR